MNHSVRRWLLAAWMVLLIVQSASAQEAPALLEPAGVQMDTFVAYRDSISQMVVYDAAVVPYVEELAFAQDGTVEEVHVVIGQLVKKGDKLISLKQETEIERLEALQEELEALEKSAAYAAQLADIDLDILALEQKALQNQMPADEEAIALKKLEIEEKKLNLALEEQLREMERNRLQSELEALENEISENVMVAPFDGRIVYGQIALEKGYYVGAYTPILYLADDQQLSIESEFISDSILKNAHAIYALIGAQRCDLVPVEMDMQEYIAQALAGETVMSQFKLADPTQMVAVGDYAALCIESKYVEDALLVPTNALFRENGESYLYVIENGGRVRRTVKTGVANDSMTQIVEGLEEGAIVYVQE